MTYDIHITRAAERDFSSAADYIEYVLLNPQAADDLLDEAEKKIGELSTFPEKFALVDDPVLKAWGIRFTLVKNYIAHCAVPLWEARLDHHPETGLLPPMILSAQPVQRRHFYVKVCILCQ